MTVAAARTSHATSIAALLDQLSRRNIFLSERDGAVVSSEPPEALSPDEQAQIRDRGAELLAFLRARRAALRAFAPLSDAEPAPALIQQMWWDWVRPAKAQLPHEKLCLIVPVDGVATGLVEAAVRRLISRHATLRSRFVEAGDGLRIEANPEDGFEVEVAELDPAPPLAAAFDAERARLLKTSMRIEGTWLSRARVLLSQGRPVGVALLIHHMVMDARSLLILEKELRGLLSAGADPAVLGGPAPQYVDYGVWERAWLERDAGPLVAYWRDWLAEAPALRAPEGGTELRWAPGLKTYYDLEIPGGTAEAIRGLAAACDCTPFSAVLTAVGLAAARWSGQPRFALRVIGDLRTSRAMAGMVGNLVCTDLVEMRAADAADPIGLMHALAAEYTAAIRLRLPNLLGLPGGTSFPDVSDHSIGAKTAITLNYLPIYAFRGPSPPSGDGRERPTAVRSAQSEVWPVPMCPINLRVWDYGTRLAAKFEFNQDLIDPAAQARFVELFIDAVQALAVLTGSKRTST